MPVVVLWSVFAAPVTVATGIALANADAWPEKRPGSVPASDTNERFLAPVPMHCARMHTASDFWRK